MLQLPLPSRQALSASHKVATTINFPCLSLSSTACAYKQSFCLLSFCCCFQQIPYNLHFTSKLMSDCLLLPWTAKVPKGRKDILSPWEHSPQSWFLIYGVCIGSAMPGKIKWTRGCDCLFIMDPSCSFRRSNKPMISGSFFFLSLERCTFPPLFTNPGTTST